MQRGPFPPSSATLGGLMLRCSILLVVAPGRKPTLPHETWIQKPWCKNSLPTGTLLLPWTVLPAYFAAGDTTTSWHIST